MQTMVGEVMTTAVARVRPETPVTQVARLLRERGVTAVPVVDEEDHVLGVVSAMDLAMDDGQSYSGPALLGCMARHPARASGAKTAAERMSSPAVSVTPDVSLRTATRLLQMHGIHHLPVVADGKLVGMVTRRDLLAAFLRGDEQVRRQIVHAMEMTFHLTSDQVAVTVHNGVVRLDGQVERRPALRHLLDERLADTRPTSDGVATWSAPPGPAPARECAGRRAEGPHLVRDIGRCQWTRAAAGLTWTGRAGIRAIRLDHGKRRLPRWLTCTPGTAAGAAQPAGGVGLTADRQPGRPAPLGECRRRRGASLAMTTHQRRRTT